MTSCAGPGAHCGSGVGVYGGVGGFASSDGGRRSSGRIAASMRARQRREPKPVDKFSLFGMLGIHLKGGHLEAPGEGAAHWFATGLGMFAKQTEQYSIGDFFERFARFLRETRLQNILLIEVDYEPVYQDKNNKPLKDIEDAIRVARQYVIRQNGKGNKILISALGRTQTDPKKDLHLTVEGQYNRKHGSGKPGLEVKVTGIPSLFLQRRKETTLAYKARQNNMSRRIDSSQKRKRFRNACEKTFKLVLDDYQHHLNGLFDIENVDKQFRTAPHV